MNTFIIIDDEPLAHEIIEEYCNMLPHVQLKRNCYNAMEAIDYLNKNKVDFMFLDIHMPKLKGFDFLKTLVNPPKVIVTTAYKEFAIEGFDLNVTDYLLKPFSFERLVKAVNKVAESENIVKTSTSTNSKKESFKFFVKGDKKQHYIDAHDILYIEAYGNYSKIHLDNERILSHEKISYFEHFLKDKGFLRVHKSFVIAMDKIKFIEGNRIIINDHKIPIGQTYKSSVNKLYNS
jgi:DNA-binding LytR/AlgR family response regulator